MKNPILPLLLALAFLVAPRGATARTLPTASPLAGNDLNQPDREAVFAADEGVRLTTLEVNTGRKFGGTIIKGLRFTALDAAGQRVETVLGPADGTYEAPIRLEPSTEIIGIRGRHGLVIDSIQFLFSNGTVSPIQGGDGGNHAFEFRLRKRDGAYRGRVRGFFAQVGADSLSGIGLLLAPRDGRQAELEHSAELELVLRGIIEPDFAPTVARLTTLFYTSYPLLLARFDHPDRPASRRVILNFRSDMRVPASCSGHTVDINIDWLKRNPGDIGLLTHELTHIVQAYPKYDPVWLVEGIADYARHLYGPAEQPGWRLPDLTPQQKPDDGYRVTAAFLLRLERRYPGIVDSLNRHLQNETYTPDTFRELTGKSLDALWTEVLNDQTP